MRRTASLIAVLSLVLMSGCGGEEEAPEQTAARTATGCEAVQAPEPRGKQTLAKPAERLSARRGYVATVKTNCGDFEVTLDVERAPLTTASFVHLARADFFDGLTFHRVSPGFVIQGGDPLGNGSGGPGYTIREAPPESLSYQRGVVAMAKTELEKPGTSGSQFFIVTAEDAGLPPDYAVAGGVTKGDDVVELLANVPNDPADNRPTEPVIIENVEVTSR